jgi:branched-chain amino acid transport system ATP-binding protein
MSTGYVGVPVVRNLSLSVDEGQIVALLGPNGAGKTATLLAVSGLNRIFSGDIAVFGHSVRGRSPHELARAGIGHVPAGRSVFSQLTVRENLRLGAARGRSGVERALGHFPALEPLMDRPAGLLSGGEQQMLAIGRALMSRPRLLLLDEPSLGLAPLLVREIFKTIVEINRGGVTVLLVEQNAHMALSIAGRGYVLETGHVRFEDEARRLLDNPDVKNAYLGG